MHVTEMQRSPRQSPGPYSDLIRNRARERLKKMSLAMAIQDVFKEIIGETYYRRPGEMWKAEQSAAIAYAQSLVSILYERALAEKKGGQE